MTFWMPTAALGNTLGFLDALPSATIFPHIYGDITLPTGHWRWQRRQRGIEAPRYRRVVARNPAAACCLTFSLLNVIGATLPPGLLRYILAFGLRCGFRSWLELMETGWHTTMMAVRLPAAALSFASTLVGLRLATNFPGTQRQIALSARTWSRCWLWLLLLEAPRCARVLGLWKPAAACRLTVPLLCLWAKSTTFPRRHRCGACRFGSPLKAPRCIVVMILKPAAASRLALRLLDVRTKTTALPRISRHLALVLRWRSRVWWRSSVWKRWRCRCRFRLWSWSRCWLWLKCLKTPR